MASLVVLEERVTNHIRFFWVVVAFGFVWLGSLTMLLLQTKSAVKGVARVEADTPAQIVAAFLGSPVSTAVQAQTNLAAAASVLQTSKVGDVRPDAAKLKSVSDKLIEAQAQYPQLPQVWETTGIFINYKSQAILAPGNETLKNVSVLSH